MSRMFSRAGRAAILDRKPFAEAFFDGNAAADAAILVSVVSAVTYIGALIVNGVIAAFSLPGLFEVVITGVISWLLLAFATWFAASRLFQATGKPQTMIALHGLAVLPLVLELFGPIGGAIALIWYLVILVVATREAAGIDTRNSAVSVLIGFAIVAIFRLLLGIPFAVFGALF